MGIEIICAVAAAAASSAYTSKAANQNVDQGESYADPILKLRRDAQGKCPCCGSRQFVDHHAVRICSYCRSEQ